MNEVMEQPALAAPSDSISDSVSRSPLLSYLPAILAITGALLMVGLRIQFGEGRFV